MTNMPEAKLAREAEIRYCTSQWLPYEGHPDHDEVDVSIVVQTLMKMRQQHKTWLKK